MSRHRAYNKKRQAHLREWFETQPHETIKDAAIAWACKQPDAQDRLQTLFDNCEATDDGCLIWKGGRNGDYSATGIVLSHLSISPAVRVSGHRYALALAKGFDALPPSIKRGSTPSLMTIDHLCGKSLCINPEHLQVITQSENSKLQGQERVVPAFTKLVLAA